MSGRGARISVCFDRLTILVRSGSLVSEETTVAETAQQYIDRMLGFVATRDPLDVLNRTATRLADLVARRTDDDLRYAPAPERWSTAAILAHLADAEVVAAYRIRMILASPGTAIQAFDQNEWASAFRYADRDPFASLGLFRSLRHGWLQIVSGVDDAWLDRYGVHQERGRETVRHLLRLYAGHDLNHLQQIERLLAEADRLRGSQAPAFEPAPVKPVIAIDQLKQLDIRVGTIRSVADVSGSDRLMRLVVDFGDRDRTVIAGIKQERWAPSSLVGRQGLFVVNLAPRTIRGETSEAMIVDIGYEDGFRPALAEPEWPTPRGIRAG
jgi:methionine--tRNA ligase beta chain